MILSPCLILPWPSGQYSNFLPCNLPLCISPFAESRPDIGPSTWRARQSSDALVGCKSSDMGPCWIYFTHPCPGRGVNRSGKRAAIQVFSGRCSWPAAPNGAVRIEDRFGTAACSHPRIYWIREAWKLHGNVLVHDNRRIGSPQGGVRSAHAVVFSLGRNIWPKVLLEEKSIGGISVTGLGLGGCQWSRRRIGDSRRSQLEIVVILLPSWSY